MKPKMVGSLFKTALCLAVTSVWFVVDAAAVAGVDEGDSGYLRRSLASTYAAGNHSDLFLPREATYRAVYRADFQVFSRGACSAPQPAVLQALCVGQVGLLNASSTSIECEFVDDSGLPEGAGSGMECVNTCSSDDACDEVYLNNNEDLGVMDGPWGEILYFCEGDELQDVDTSFGFLDSGTGACDDTSSLLDTNILLQNAKLSVFCPLEATMEEEESEIFSISRQGPTLDEAGGMMAWFVPVNDDNFVECGADLPFCPIDFQDGMGGCQNIEDTEPLDRNAGPFNPYDGMTNELVCGSGMNCGADSCTVSFRSIYVEADYRHFQQTCVDTLLEEEIPPPETVNISHPTGAYTAQFKARWALLFKDAETWEDPPDMLFCNRSESTVRIQCNNNGTIRFENSSSADTISCEQEAIDTLSCTQMFDEMAYNESVNSGFSDVTYTCCSDRLPTTNVEYVPGNVSCSNSTIMDNEYVVAAPALQLGLYCTNSSLAEDGYRYDDYLYECQLDDYYHFLDADGSGGNRFTCTEGIMLKETEGWVALPEVQVSTDFRYEVNADETCYMYDPTDDGSGCSAPREDFDDEPSASPSDSPSRMPSDTPSLSPTSAQTVEPTLPATGAPSNPPSDGATETPTSSPSALPTASPSAAPTSVAPSSSPSAAPSANTGPVLLTVRSFFGLTYFQGSTGDEDRDLTSDEYAELADLMDEFYTSAFEEDPAFASDFSSYMTDITSMEYTNGGDPHIALDFDANYEFAPGSPVTVEQVYGKMESLNYQVFITDYLMRDPPLNQLDNVQSVLFSADVNRA